MFNIMKNKEFLNYLNFKYSLKSIFYGYLHYKRLPNFMIIGQSVEFDH